MSRSYSISSGSVVMEVNSHHPAAAVQVSHLDLVRRSQHIVKPEGAYRLDLCTTPRLPSRMRFDGWAPNRFERPGRLFVVPPGETLAVWNDLGRESVVVCHLFTEAMSQWLEEAIEPSGDLLDISTDITSTAIEHLMLRLREEVQSPGFASEVMIEALAMQMAVELQRHYRHVEPAAKSGGLAPWRLRRIDERLKSSDDPAGLLELADLCRLSVRQLSRGFQASRGVSIGQYVANLRIEKAKEALAAAQSIKSVATSIGFSSTAAFCYAFRKATGLTPSEFRRMASPRR